MKAGVAVTLALLTTACGRDARPARTPDPGVATDTTTLTNADAKESSIRPSAEITRACALSKTPSPAEAPKFDFDDVTITDSERAMLGEIAACLTTGPLKGRKVRLVGRADPRGTEQYNMALGAKRANAVASYLANLGVEGSRLRETSRGELDANGTDEASWRTDRRVDLALED